MSDSIVVAGVGVIYPAQSGSGVVKKVNRLDVDYESSLLSARDSKRHNRVSKMVLDATKAAICSSGLSEQNIETMQVGMVSGSMLGCMDAMDNTHKAWLDSEYKHGLNPVEFSKATYNFPVSSTMLHFGLQGPAASLVSGRTSGVDALELAMAFLEGGDADAMIIVAYEEFVGVAEQLILDIPSRHDTDHITESCVALLLVKQSSACKERMLDLRIRGVDRTQYANFDNKNESRKPAGSVGMSNLFDCDGSDHFSVSAPLKIANAWFSMSVAYNGSDGLAPAGSSQDFVVFEKDDFGEHIYVSFGIEQIYAHSQADKELSHECNVV